MTFCAFVILVLFIILAIFYWKFKCINKKYSTKLELLYKEVEKKKRLDMFKSYHEVFKISRHIFTHLKPERLSLYFYQNKKELNNNTILKFVYQLQNNDGDGSVTFNGEHDNIPITNISYVTKAYTNENKICIIDNIDDLNDYDNGLYQDLSSRGIKRLYLCNIYCNCKKNKPIGFFALSYKDKKLSDKEQGILIKESIKISFPLLEILRNE